MTDQMPTAQAAGQALAALQDAKRELAAAHAQRDMAEHGRLMGEAMDLIRWAIATLVAANAGAVTATLQLRDDRFAIALALTMFLLSTTLTMTGGWAMARSLHTEATASYIKALRAQMVATGTPIHHDHVAVFDREIDGMETLGDRLDMTAGVTGALALVLFCIGGLLAIWF